MAGEELFDRMRDASLFFPDLFFMLRGVFVLKHLYNYSGGIVVINTISGLRGVQACTHFPIFYEKGVPESRGNKLGVIKRRAGVIPTSVDCHHHKGGRIRHSFAHHL